MQGTIRGLAVLTAGVGLLLTQQVQAQAVDQRTREGALRDLLLTGSRSCLRSGHAVSALILVSCITTRIQ